MQKRAGALVRALWQLERMLTSGHGAGSTALDPGRARPTRLVMAAGGRRRRHGLYRASRSGTPLKRARAQMHAGASESSWLSCFTSRSLFRNRCLHQKIGAPDSALHTQAGTAFRRS